MNEFELYKVKIYTLRTSPKTGRVHKKYYGRQFFKSHNEAQNFITDRQLDMYFHNDIQREQYSIQVGTFNEFKDEITIADYESLFSTKIEPNTRLRTDDLYYGICVWNESRSKYSLIYDIRSVLNHQFMYPNLEFRDTDGDYINNDELYRYPINRSAEYKFKITPNG